MMDPESQLYSPEATRTSRSAEFEESEAVKSDPEALTAQSPRRICSLDLARNFTKVKGHLRYDAEAELLRVGKKAIVRQKYCMISLFVSVKYGQAAIISSFKLTALYICSFMFTFSAWWWSHYFYIYLPFVTLTVALNCVMVASIIVFSTKHRLMAEKIIIPDKPETLVLLMPCYNENMEECTKSLDSLVSQIDIEHHPRAIMIVCDGKVRGPGMEKTTAQYLLEDILVEKTSRKYIKGAYSAWDSQDMDVVVQMGRYKSLPYFCIIKQQNQGKRDSLILTRSFLYKFNTRSGTQDGIFSPAFFRALASFLLNDAGIDHVTLLIGMDADTIFEDTCISELLKQSRYVGTVGVCGYVAVDFKHSNWNPWGLYQSSEYTISQALRRLHQSIATNKVSCLPGCCQLLRICEATCGDHVLINLFGYCPKPIDHMLKQIRATASEDRNHVCLMLSARPKSRTRQALKARAYTDVPRSWAVFLSQRRRWTLGATSNDLMLVTAPGVQWFERILAFANVLTWSLCPFILASLGTFIRACLCESDCLGDVMLEID